MKIKNWFLSLSICFLGICFYSSITLASGTVTTIPADTGDTAFMLICASLVMLMTPGLAFFYGGMVRRKNTLNTIMQSFILIALVSVQWVLIGYTLSFAPHNGLFGSLKWLGLSGVGQTVNPDYAGTIPHQVFMIYQLMFAIITVALITGSVAERMRFPAFVIFSLLWTTIVYDPLAHWVWGVGGWIRNMGALDFAGGTVVHISSGVSALVAALILGKRKSYGQEPIVPHNLTMTVLGAGLLWFGWFGFNAGSALGANGLAGSAFMVTNTAAAMATLSWVLIEWLDHGKPTMLGAASGCIAGLVAITPAAGFVTPISALIIGLVAGIICYLGVSKLKAKLGYDDALDVFGVHGIGGTWGALATGLFATKFVNTTGANGLFYGNPKQIVIQFISVIITYLLAGVLTFAILKIMGLFMKLRVTTEEEDMGLDLTQHGENAYEDFVLGIAVRDHLSASIPVSTIDKVAASKNISVDLPKSTSHVGMSKIECILRPNKLEEINIALTKLGIPGMTIEQVMGCGLQKGHKEVYRGMEYSMNLLPKIKVEIILSNKHVEQVVNIISQTVHTGEIGDGKIFVYPVTNAIRIRTGEIGEEAV